MSSIAITFVLSIRKMLFKSSVDNIIEDTLLIYLPMKIFVCKLVLRLINTTNCHRIITTNCLKTADMQ